MSINTNATQILDAQNGAKYHINGYYDREYRIKGYRNGRPFFETSGAFNKATIEWSEFTTNGLEDGQMAWVVLGRDRIRFVSFSGVNEPQLAESWKYHTDENVLIDASDFQVSIGKFLAFCLLLEFG